MKPTNKVVTIISLIGVFMVSPIGPLNGLSLRFCVGANMTRRIQWRSNNRRQELCMYRHDRHCSTGTALQARLCRHGSTGTALQARLYSHGSYRHGPIQARLHRHGLYRQGSTGTAVQARLCRPGSPRAALKARLCRHGCTGTLLQAPLYSHTYPLFPPQDTHTP